MSGVVFNRIMGASGGSGEYASIFVTGLSQSSSITGTKPSGGAISGVWGTHQVHNPEHSGIPSAYTQRRYVQADGNCYIDTGISLGGSDFDIAMKFGYTHDASSYDEQPICSIWTSSYNYWNFFVASGSMLDFYASAHTYDGSVSVGGVYDVVVRRSGSTYTFGLTSSTATKSYSSTSNTTSLKLLGRGDGQSISYNALYSCTVSVGGTERGEYIPCTRNSDNAVGVYNKTTNTFIQFTGSGTPLYGDAIPEYITTTCWQFLNLDEYGTYTFTSGGKTMTQEVDEADEYTLAWDDGKLWLYRDGDECEDITGGWGTGGYSQDDAPIVGGIKNTDKLYFQGSTNKYTLLGTISGINVTNYSKVCAFVNYVQRYSSVNNFYITLSSSKTNCYSTNFIGESVVSGLGEQTLEYDLSSVSGNIYISLGIGGVTSYIGYVYKVWLE